MRRRLCVPKALSCEPFLALTLSQPCNITHLRGACDAVAQACESQQWGEGRVTESYDLRPTLTLILLRCRCLNTYMSASRDVKRFDNTTRSPVYPKTLIP